MGRRKKKNRNKVNNNTGNNKGQVEKHTGEKKQVPAGVLQDRERRISRENNSDNPTLLSSLSNLSKNKRKQQRKKQRLDGEDDKVVSSTRSSSEATDAQTYNEKIGGKEEEEKDEDEKDEEVCLKRWLTRKGCPAWLTNNLPIVKLFFGIIFIAFFFVICDRYVLYPLSYEGGLIRVPVKERAEGSWDDFFRYPYGKPDDAPLPKISNKTMLSQRHSDGSF